jgi:hypothetical protein
MSSQGLRIPCILNCFSATLASKLQRNVISYVIFFTLFFFTQNYFACQVNLILFNLDSCNIYYSIYKKYLCDRVSHACSEV